MRRRDLAGASQRDDVADVPERDDFADVPELASFGAQLRDAMRREERHPSSVRSRIVALLCRPLSRRAVAITVAALLAGVPAAAAAVHYGPGALRSLTGAGDSGRSSVPGLASCGRTIHSRSALCPNLGSFEPEQYLHRGDVTGCDEFATQADAQTVLRLDPRDPNKLDDDRDGVACPYLPAPRDLDPVKAIVANFACRPSDVRSARCPQPSQRFDPGYYLRFPGDAFDCDDLATQADAQAVLRLQPQDPNRLDGDGDGIACPKLPGPRDLRRVVTRLPS